MPDFSNTATTGLPPINNFKAKNMSDEKTVSNPLQELEKSRGPDYVNNDNAQGK